MTRQNLLLAAALISSFGAQAQTTFQRTLTWNSPVGTTRAAAGTAPKSPSFLGAMVDMDRQELPFFHESFSLQPRTSSFVATVEVLEAAPLTAAEIEALPGLGRLEAQPLVRQHLSIHRKRPVGLVDVYPYRRNPGTGRVERVTSFTVTLTETKGAQPFGRLKSYPAHSRLASGEWYRMTVDQDGVYKLDYNFLRDLGVDVDGLASDQINIYGNHFGLLPFQNSVERPTDLMLNAIQVVDGGDGQFGPNDYILFYADGAQRWDYDQAGQVFHHTKNVYTDSASYFIGIGVDPPSRIGSADLTSDPVTHSVTAFDDRQCIEHDLVNLIKSGREFYGETFDLVDAYNYSFSLPFLRPDSPVKLVTAMAARTPYSSPAASSFTVSVGSLASMNISILGVGTGYTGPYGREGMDTLVFNSSQSTLPITITFNPYDPVSCIGWTNYLEVNARRDLKFTGNQLAFRDLSSVGAGNVAEFTMDLASSAQSIWEITDPTNVRNVAFSTSGSQKTFRIHSDSLRQFIAFKGDNYLLPTAIGAVANQDLHATPLPTDLVIVCPPQFRGQAQRLADHRSDEGLTVRIVSPQEIFNEFSSGARDATAIKRYMRMLYDRAGTDTLLLPRYLLLFGDGSYNNTVLSESNQNWIPSYESANSFDLSKSYTSDDYFGLLDASEGESNLDLVDIGVGRLPVSSVDQATAVVDKLLAYDRLSLLSSGVANCATGGTGGANDWRTWVLFASDDQNGADFEGWVHMQNSDALATRVDNEHPELNVAKVYMDAYQQQSTPGGERYPDAEADLRDRVQKGALLVNYVGHGGEVGWAHERFLDNNTILGWTNSDRLPLFMTATCEFSRWDDPSRTSAGENVLLNPDGGGIGLMTTTRLAYSNQNQTLAMDFFDNAFRTTDEQGRIMRFGDIYRRTKVAATPTSGTATNHRIFALLGDPSARLAIPHMNVVTSSITDTLGNAVDTLKALSTIRVSGMITDGNGQQITDFNGVVIPTVFDKRVAQSTLANDGGTPFPYSVRKNVVYRGKATVVNGAFSFTFVVPKDIQYQFGPGRISYYAESSSTNADGYTNDPIVGGTATDVALDAQGPKVDLYLNDERFVRGGITNESPLLYAKLFDDNGINTLGNSIGHDLLATLDDNTQNALVLNDLYEADLDTYKSGIVRYRFSGLSEGTHTLTLKAWDVFNNSSEATTEFVVAPSAELALDHVLNYPNPFTTYTEFYFEHNRPCSELEVQVQVFTVSGRLVKTLNRRLTCDGFRVEPLAWNGLDDYGDKLGRGVYVYRVHVKTPEGDSAEKYEKLVILR